MQIAELFVALQFAPDVKSLNRSLQMAEKRVDRWGARLKKKLGGAFSNFAGALGLSPGMLGAGALGGIFVSGFKDALSFSDQLDKLSIASQGAMGSTKAVREQILNLSRETGVAKEQLLQGAGAFIALTGDGKAATKAMEIFAKVSVATGASMEDISGAAAAMFQNLAIKPEEFEKAFSILIRGGKMGAVELKDMAGLLAELAPLAEQFRGGSGTAGLASLGAAFQLTRQGAGSASQAATQLEALMGALVQNAGKFGKAGIKVFDERTVNGKKVKELRSLEEIVFEIANSKLARDPELLVKALGRKEAYSAFLQLTKVKGAWGKLADETMKANDLGTDFSKRQQNDAVRVAKAWNDVKVTLAEMFTPDRIKAFSEALIQAFQIAGRLVSHIAEIAGFIADPTGEKAKKGLEKVADKAVGIYTLGKGDKDDPLGTKAWLNKSLLNPDNAKYRFGQTDANAPSRLLAATAQRSIGMVNRAAVSINAPITVNGAQSPMAIANQIDRHFKGLLRDAQAGMAAP